mmetsp:Transcript_12773/g.54653  ORF Transcript_12773/g.54653 Transcript_12773/m.54653 type:complete len:355 (+) Transcript_12773:597-1661(+)
MLRVMALGLSTSGKSFKLTHPSRFVSRGTMETKFKRHTSRMRIAVATAHAACTRANRLSFASPRSIGRVFPNVSASTAASKLAAQTSSRPSRAAAKQAEFTTLAMMAPVNPFISAARSARSTSGLSGLSRTCTFRICRRPSRVGGCTVILRSNRPARTSALSKTSIRLVAAITTTPASLPKPSSSTNSWFKVWSRSSLPDPPAPRGRPMASSSSMKMMLGACFFACAKRSRTRAAPTPTNISTNSDAVSEKNVAPDSPATARAKSVLPHPGGPVSMTPFGTFAPEVLNFSGLRKKSTISASSILASPMPATSANLTISLSSRIFIFERSFPCLRSSFFFNASFSARSSITSRRL